MRLQDIAIVTGTPLDSDALLLEKFRAHDRVQYDIKTGLYSYKVDRFLHDVCLANSFKHDFDIRNKDSLLTEIQRQAWQGGGGISVRMLKESWKEAPIAVEELEKDGLVLVTRTAKDNQLKMVFWNEIKPNEESGGLPVEQGEWHSSNLCISRPNVEFMDLWHELKVPNDVDLLKQLASGMLSFDPAVSTKQFFQRA